jgi:hypothetical protein
MKSEQFKEITDRAAERLVAALQACHSEALTAYLKATYARTKIPDAW